VPLAGAPAATLPGMKVLQTVPILTAPWTARVMQLTDPFGNRLRFQRGPEMTNEKIKLRTETGQLIEVVVLSKRADFIEVVIGEGVHNVRCQLQPTRNGLAYAGKVMGREVIYERSREQVQADIDRLNPSVRKPRGR
jgi:hypothetical protein